MSIRKRKWTNPKGIIKEAWVVDYVDSQGTRRLKTFAKKKEADAFSATAKIEVREGVHVADSASATVAQAGGFWIASGENDSLERSTINQRQRHVKLHIDPFIGNTLLSRLNVPAIREFEDKLRDEDRSPAMIKKIIGSLGSILADAQERGLTIRNPVKDMRGTRRTGKDRQAERRQNGRIKVGIDIPTREEIKALINAIDGRWKPLLITAIFTGMRSSELRGLRWQDVDFEKRAINVHQRADEFGEIGRPKSGAGERTIPVPPLVINTLREWKLACPRRETVRLDPNGNPVTELHYVFPNGLGKIESHANIINRGLIPVQIKAGITQQDGQEVKAKYTGLHALRHFYASWCINRLEDGGLGLPLKVVQERMGHSSVTMTADTYGHLFPRGDDAAELAAAEHALLS
ncbi:MULTISPECIES: tyrosine-type recombinase/integrase [Pseudochrobactrum]|uniref:tyrosine-type recombinase/integrase n=1 Tax=Pseudochrobactrum TaxID=354349 RepID=UPI00039ADBD8|nr:MULTISPECIES: site-specific integrase [Pseudochrobactrum]MBX8785097.1 site-specific integrase [Ochrobactrum sp. GRS2]MDP8250079.1 site-specific integrase [Pseudochrobactrum saccharolyticum]UCA44878.1 site-specific integrase [Pseudochrobactrum sp. XF203]